MQADEARGSEFSSSAYPLALVEERTLVLGSQSINRIGRQLQISVDEARCSLHRYSGLAPPQKSDTVL